MLESPVVDKTAEVLVIFSTFLLRSLRLVLDFLASSRQSVLHANFQLLQLSSMLLQSSLVSSQNRIESISEMRELVCINRYL